MRYGDFKESLCNNFPVPTAVQTKFAPIAYEEVLLKNGTFRPADMTN